MRVAAPSAWLVLIAGAVGLLASATLTAEKIRVLTDPAYVPSCNLNPVLSCGSVMGTSQASLLGLPNPLLGVVAYTVVLVTGLLAVTKVALPRWYWMGLTFGALAGAGFVHWLIFASLYRIGALCPYCMVVWTVTIPLLVAVASIAFAPSASRPVAHAVHRWRWSLTALWFVTLILLIFIRFQDYWATLV
ncbi:MAG TPA: vitamin K epoxide reductase family protein [Mycobacterium sp.]|nr:vitamin K epoxide reductase family protein [Mycobacterium sp.]